MSEFLGASSVHTVGDGLFRAAVPDGWQQGRGAFGGLVLAALVRAMRASVPSERRLRSLTAELCAPVLPGEARVRVSTLREGKNLSNVEAAMIDGSDVLARASGVFSTPRRSNAPDIAPPAPKPLDWGAVTPAEITAFAPVFARHFEYRSTGPAPFSRASEPLCEGFIRLRDRDASLDEPAIIALLDAWWPAVFSIAEGPRPIATVSFTAELLCDPADLSAETPLRYVGRVVGQRDGFFVEFRELWADGALVAMNQQTFAILA
jgi:hypothetical protein